MFRPANLGNCQSKNSGEEGMVVGGGESGSIPHRENLWDRRVGLAICACRIRRRGRLPCLRRGSAVDRHTPTARISIFNDISTSFADDV